MSKRLEIIQELNNLTSTYNFLEVLLNICDEDHNTAISDLSNRNIREILNINETAFLFGLWLKNWKKEFYKIGNISSVILQVRKLMKDLQLSLLDGTLKPNKETSLESYMMSGSLLLESIFYSGSGAYDYQFIEFVGAKYFYDNNWIYNNMGYKIEDAKNFYVFLKSILNFKLNKHQPNTHTFDCFYYHKDSYIFKAYPEFRKIIKSFSININASINSEFNNIGDFNEFIIKPIIELEDTYIIPIPYLIAEAIYDSPFYWMNSDISYKDTALLNRGKSAEEIVKRLLEQVFPKNEVFNNVNVMVSKSKTLTDLDVCVIHGSILLIFQVKSKKLTQLSKQGDTRKIKDDFQKAVEEAFNQAQVAYKPILERKCKLLTKEGSDLMALNTITEIYSICVVLDNFPSITSLTRSFSYENDSTPIAMSIFDLQIVVHYLSIAERFIDYFIKRTNNSKYFISDNELSFLQYYLSKGLERSNNADGLLLDGDFAQQFDEKYYLQLLSKYEGILPKFVKKISRNDKCFCGSGLKYKYCCERIETSIFS